MVQQLCTGNVKDGDGAVEGGAGEAASVGAPGNSEDKVTSGGARGGGAVRTGAVRAGDGEGVGEEPGGGVPELERGAATASDGKERALHWILDIGIEMEELFLFSSVEEEEERGDEK